jgi:hypothetical protein
VGFMFVRPYMQRRPNMNRTLVEQIVRQGEYWQAYLDR